MNVWYVLWLIRKVRLVENAVEWHKTVVEKKCRKLAELDRIGGGEHEPNRWAPWSSNPIVEHYPIRTARGWWHRTDPLHLKLRFDPLIWRAIRPEPLGDPDPIRSRARTGDEYPTRSAAHHKPIAIRTEPIWVDKSNPTRCGWSQTGLLRGARYEA